jgi:hypothetical protein
MVTQPFGTLPSMTDPNINPLQRAASTHLDQPSHTNIWELSRTVRTWLGKIELDMVSDLYLLTVRAVFRTAYPTSR